MRHRRLLLFGLALAGFAAVGVAIVSWLARPTNRINKASYEAIDMDMTEKQVEAILGCLAGDYRTAEIVYEGHAEIRAGLKTLRTPTRTRDWHSNEASVQVVFDQHGPAM